ncbi:MAG: L-tyrosine/L-tryptophan isonitrile synthase family protein [Pseudomonadota bacterium]
MKTKLNYTRKSLVIALLMTTHCATASSVFCMEDLPQSEAAHTSGMNVIATPACLKASPIAFDKMSVTDREIITRHIDSLPRMQESGDAIARLTGFLKKCIKNKPQAPLYDLIQQAIVDGEPLQCVMLGFPVKSQDMREVYDSKAGLGDLLSLLTLHHIAYEIQKVHAPGAKFQIISDYVALKKIVAHESAEIYQRDIQRLIDLFPGTLEYDRSFHDAEFAYVVSEEQAQNTRYEKASYTHDEKKIAEAKAKSSGFSDYITGMLKNIPHIRFSVHHYNNGKSNKLTLPFFSKKLGAPCHHVCTVNADSKCALGKYKTQEGHLVGEIRAFELPTMDGSIIPLTYFKNLEEQHS